MAVFFLFFTIQFGVLGLIAEKETGAMARLVAAPIRPAAILGGKALATFVVGVAATAAIVVGSTYLPLKADWGDPGGVALVALVCVFCAMGILALIGSLAHTAEQAVNYVTVVAVVFGLLGGAFFPAALSGGPVELLSRFTPHRWMIEGFRRLAAGDSIADIVPILGIVLAIGAATGAIGLARFRKEVTSA
jgi:ABC-2 type transport system permease protein